MRWKAKPKTENLHERFVMPGFNDAHMHLGSAGRGHAGRASLRRELHRRTEKKRVAASAAFAQARRMDHRRWLGPTRSGPTEQFPQQVDARRTSHPKIPVLLTHVSGHVAIAQFAGPQARRTQIRIPLILPAAKLEAQRLGRTHRHAQGRSGHGAGARARPGSDCGAAPPRNPPGACRSSEERRHFCPG